MRSIVEKTTHYEDYELITGLSKKFRTAMKGIEISTILPEHRMQERRWQIYLLIPYLMKYTIFSTSIMNESQSF
ncbi:hypothetical protein J2W47_005016 [Priestia megaterium]|nr:hypothetical protein [Priestia megaterium]